MTPQETYAKRMRCERDEAQLASLEQNERDTKIILQLRGEMDGARMLIENVQNSANHHIPLFGFGDEATNAIDGILQLLGKDAAAWLERNPK